MVLGFDKKAPRIRDAGWHFTSIADLDGIAEKLRNTAHQEYASFAETRLAVRLAKIRAGKLEPGWERCELDERFPEYIRQRQSALADVLL